MMPATVPLLIISRSIGAVKTTVHSETSDLLSQAGIAHAAIDLDCWQPGIEGLTRDPRSLEMPNVSRSQFWRGQFPD